MSSLKEHDINVQDYTRCYIAIGSNLADPIAQAKEAITALKTLTESRFISVSSLYASKPMGPQEQPDYINAVACVGTHLAPIELLDALQQIENEQGRVRKEHWGARTLDLDILLYGDEVMSTPRLTVPHYGMKEREFVLYPLAEIAPQLQLPCGQALSALLEACPRNGLAIYQNIE
ncbi:2-amino-4-hydroxy-6-hydroxymethyldihydropteridine diphosphokinase [Moritella viscosa]|uniref:2-amino-4-hydroxy-6-hydroxymethyldihydropteridine pyrophosphokinase n=1 Tax=Moritella viscosa TaxID=80854 RepID=A0ABY1HEV1_9GAMM|nr:2-amino-4-hydroxy-6-hydroxymethyl-dihydropteridine diphosphokinase [Moritella viscosa]SGY89245.1 7;8-dihydro-6-hydroxymethylpterin-pyrophosphokinase [Moritella viscosa]SGY93237.1 7;8-dihydro-6-hydroxymethylpterin-pyrophosphokinase [Moritella viscosa]SGY97165.1 7;8-dihydro-6-hydroxymethylpterin-pyrophosphokinase [Moritella viscosa]SHO04600.1 7;8-dihydro-6-hydroxymethylpterin-pyrophosphokinase [Moritella viscosa]